MIKFLPYLIAIEAALAALSYVYQRDWRHAFYWGASALITYSATLL